MVEFLVVVVVSIMVVCVGIFGLISPAGVVGFIARWQSPAGLWTASIARLVFGIALWLVAPSSRTPVVLKVVSVVSVASAVVLLVAGVSRFESILSWWSHQAAVFQRGWSAVAVAGGAFILWSVIMKRNR
jgi:hypothetical protein